MFEAKHKHPEVRWKGIPVILTANRLPVPLYTKVVGEEGYEDYMAFRARMKFTYLEKSYKNRDKFPYNIQDLAFYLLKTLEIA